MFEGWRTSIAVTALCALAGWAAYSREPAPLGYFLMAAACALPWGASHVWVHDSLLSSFCVGVAMLLPGPLVYGIGARIPTLVLAQGAATAIAAALVWKVILERLFHRRLSRSKTAT